MSTFKIAKVAVSSATYAIDKPYDYLIPDELAGAVSAGCRVMLPFGRGNRTCEGMVLALAESTSRDKLKPITSVLDSEPVLDARSLKLALWMRGRCFCTLYDAVKAMLPSGLWFSMRDTYAIAEGWDRELAYIAAGRSERARLVLDTVFAAGGQTDIETIRAALDGSDPDPALRTLVDKGVLRSETYALKNVGEKTMDIVTLVADTQEAMEAAAAKKRSAPLQSSVLELLCTIGSAASKELCYFTGASSATLRSLAKKGFVEISSREVYRRPQTDAVYDPEEIVLSAEQSAAMEGVDSLCQAGKPAAALLYGVTGSGKTQVYMRLIERTLARGKTAIVLVPEISLTPQLLRKFITQFGDRVAILHSSLRPGERHDEWRRIKRGEARIVVGTRSAIFAPVEELGLIVLDEEQEQSYKSENSPRYHARDVAKYRCAQENAVLLLGSATPSVESAYFAKTGKYKLFTLKKRYNEHALPKVMLADMKQELQEGNEGVISSVLLRELQANISRGEQSILFINRRGNSRLLTCTECGHVIECDRCSVTLTYHSANNRLMCHYCGRSVPVPELCPKCYGRMRTVGAGTQRVQEELEALLPGTAMLRMDTDTVSAANTHEKILDKFDKKKIPILIGTQMVAKGLDFENVTLVGVLDADMSLYVDSYRANERSFSLITQVVGRAGRGSREGRAVIQTFTPANPIIQLAAAQDYDGFFESEILSREYRSCPPFSDVYTISFSGVDDGAVFRSSVRFRDRLRQLLDSDMRDLKMLVMGPAPAAVARVNNRYRYRLTLSSESGARVRQLLEFLIKEHSGDKQNRGVSVFADVNAYD